MMKIAIHCETLIRRNLLNNGILDNIKKQHTEYYIEGNANTIKNDLFTI